MDASLSGAVWSMVQLRKARKALADAMAFDPDVEHLWVLTQRDAIAIVESETAKLAVYCEALNMSWNELRPLLLDLEHRLNDRT